MLTIFALTETLLMLLGRENSVLELAKVCLSGYHIVADQLVWRYYSSSSSRNFIRSRQLGAMPPKVRQAAVYVHFDRRGIVHDYVVYQLRELVDADFDVIFVTNSPVFPTSSFDRIAELCTQIIWRDNVGYDFGAYKDGIEAVPHLGDLDRLVLLNDSVYGPFRPLATIFREMNATATDFWGIVDSWQGRYHLQSFLLCFLPRALRSPAFLTFWRAFPYVSHKPWIIRNGEIGLSQALAHHGLRGRAMVPYWDAAETAKNNISVQQALDHHSKSDLALLQGLPLNPMHQLWDHVFLQYDCPYIKRQLLQTSSPEQKKRRLGLIESHTRYDVSMIERHQSYEA
jgi:lipopolysaccharide biosynthesis protein